MTDNKTTITPDLPERFSVTTKEDVFWQTQLRYVFERLGYKLVTMVYRRLVCTMNFVKKGE